MNINFILFFLIVTVIFVFSVLFIEGVTSIALKRAKHI